MKNEEQRKNLNLKNTFLRDLFETEIRETHLFIGQVNCITFDLFFTTARQDEGISNNKKINDNVNKFLLIISTKRKTNSGENFLLNVKKAVRKITRTIKIIGPQ